MEMATILATMPDMWRAVLAEHGPDQRGRCRACRDLHGEAPLVPCLIRQVAEEARFRYEGGLPGTLTGDHALI